MLYLVLLPFKGHAQVLRSEMDAKYFDRDFFKEAVIEKVNRIRDSLSIHPLVFDEILQNSARDQAYYCFKSSETTTEQSNKKKSSPQKRIQYYGGAYGLVAEMVEGLTIGAKVKIKSTGKKIKVITYGDLLKVTMGNLEGAKETHPIFLRDYYKVGIGIAIDDENGIIHIVIDIASEAYEFPEGVKFNKKAFGIKEYSIDACKKLNDKFPYLPELLSNSVFVEDGEIKFYYHDLTYFKDIIEKGSDALAVDIIQKDQFECGKGNKFHPSVVHNGLLLKPLKKGSIYSKNTLEDEGALQFSFGDFPATLDTAESEMNLLVIKDKCLCQTIKYNHIVGKPLKNVQLNFEIDTTTYKVESDAIVRQIEFMVPFKIGKWEYDLEDIKPLLDSLRLNHFDIKEIDLIAFSSLDGRKELNKELQKKRAESILSAIEEYKDQTIKTVIVTKENWGGFYASIKGSPYEIEFKNMPQEQIRRIVNSDSTNYDLEIYLEDQRKAEIVVTLETIIKDSLLTTMIVDRFRHAVYNHEYEKAKAIQTVMYDEAKKGVLKIEDLYEVKIPHQKGFIPLLNNMAVFRGVFSDVKNKDSLSTEIKREFTTYQRINPNYPQVKYNRLLLELNMWAQKLSRVKVPKVLLKTIRSLYNSKIATWKVNQLVLSFNIILADHYYERKEFGKRKKALREVKRILISAELNRDQTFEIANFFIMQMRLDWVVEIMLPWVEKQNIDEEFLFQFLSIAIYEEKKVPLNKYLEYLIKAKELNTERFCAIFGAPMMNIQLLADGKIKQLYCTTCK